jgi:hypothetical protein
MARRNMLPTKNIQQQGSKAVNDTFRSDPSCRLKEEKKQARMRYWWLEGQASCRILKKPKGDKKDESQILKYTTL